MNKKFRNSLLPIGLIISLVACRLALPPATPPTATVPAGLPPSRSRSSSLPARTAPFPPISNFPIFIRREIRWQSMWSFGLQAIP